MARTNSVNFTGANQFPMASAGTDIFKKEDVQVLAKSTDLHDHSPGLGLPVSAASIPAGAIDGSKITDGTITSAKIQDGTIATADLANQSVTNAKLGTDTARLNLLTNGGFEIWQRGNGPFTTNGFAADRWSVNLAGTDTMSVTRDTTNIDASLGSVAAAACVVTVGTGGGSTSFFQVLKQADGPGLSGRTMSASIRLRCATANAARVGFYNGASYTYSNFHTGDGTWQTLTSTVTCTGSTWQVGIWFSASCTAYVDNAMLVVGSVPADYAPLHPADDLARCLRYYEVIGEAMNITTYMAAASQSYGVYINYKVPKAVTPTITIKAGWTAANCSQPTNVGSSAIAMTLQTTIPAAGAFQLAAPSPPAITVEANP